MSVICCYPCKIVRDKEPMFTLTEAEELDLICSMDLSPNLNDVVSIEREQLEEALEEHPNNPILKKIEDRMGNENYIDFVLI